MTRNPPVKTASKRPKPTAKSAERPAKVATPAAVRAAIPAKPATPETRAKPRTAAKKPAATQPAPEAKVVRDGFTMPQVDYDLLKALKAQCLAAGVEVRKSELLRAGVQALAALTVANLIERVRAMTPVKAGRKKKKS